ncbi:hypothetical protein OQA88_9164 [Cercophora sp. LCS_1]
MLAKTLTLLAACVAYAVAATITIAVGKDNFSFSPNSVTASQGDIIQYQFFAPNHSVIMGDFATPCSPAKTGGFNSGFFATAESGMNSNAFEVTVNTTEPIFFYCGFPSHCQIGMSGAINPSSEQSLSAYQKGAQSVASTVVPDGVFGGQVVAASGGTSGGSSSTPTSPGGGGAGPSGGPTGSGAVALAVPVVGAFLATILMM